MRKNVSVSGFMKRYLLVVSSVVVILMGIYSISAEIIRSEQNSERLRKEVIQERKSHIKHQVDAAILTIDFVRNDVQNNLHHNIKQRVSDAYNRLIKIYNKHKGSMSDVQLKLMLLESIRYDRFFNDRGYYYIFDNKGYNRLSPMNPSNEGECILYNNYSNNTFPIVEILKTLKIKDSAFIDYYWQGHNRNDKNKYKKTALVRKLPFYNWVLGTGDYVLDIEKEAKEKAIQKLKMIRYDEFGYIFVNTYGGKAVIINSKTLKRGDDISDIEDPDGVRIFDEELKQAAKVEGGYISYKWYEPSLNRYKDNISFIKGVDDWQWIVGAFTDVSLLDNLIEENKDILYIDLYKRTALILFFLFVIIAVVYYISNSLKQKIDNAFNGIYVEFKQAVRSKRLIDVSMFSFNESIALVEQTNRVLARQNILDVEVKEKNRFLQTLIDSIPLTVFYKDTDGIYQGCNSAYCDFLGMPKDRIVGKGLYEVFLKDQADFFKKADDELFASGGTQVYDTTMVGKDGNVMHVNFHKAVYHNKLGEPIGMLGIMIDITDRVRIKHELERNEKKLTKLNNTKDRFFSIIAHDLKNPFNSLMGLLDILINEYDELDDVTRKQYLRVVNNSSNDLFRLLTNLLEWSRTQISGVDFNPKMTSIYSIVDTELKVLENQALKKNISISSNISESISATVDKNMIATVIRNLISNSIKFTNKGGAVKIVAKEFSDHIVICVSDNGIGISKDKQVRFFKINEKISSEGTEQETGTGLGLILCKEFIEKHNGSISIISEEGKGSEFCVSLPK